MNNGNETIVYQERPSWLYYYLLYILGIILFAVSANIGRLDGGFFVLLIVVGLAAVFRFRYLFTITNDRIIMREGLIARNTNEMKVRHIRSMHVKQNPIERILGIGTLTVISAADGEAAVVFKGINDPQMVKETIYKMIDR
ncbi:MAG: PH domain-containing protein [Nitrospirae bacterium]|nr:PH domain-containing protein [Nitrospirota bacterium]